MMLTLLTLSLVSQSDTLKSVTVDGVSFKAPTKWTASVSDGNSEWAAGEDAHLAVSVFQVNPPTIASVCLTQLLEKVGKEGFELTKVGKEPAAKKLSSDTVGEGDKAVKVTSTTMIGCNGKTKWLLTWTARVDMGTRFGPLVKRIVDSISYGKKK
jgi:hypothetical protein